MIYSKMVRIDRDVFIPKSYVETIKPGNNKHLLFILSPNAKFARLVPCSENVTKIKLLMPLVAPKFLRKMEQVYFHSGIKPLHTSASNNENNPLVYESYIDNQNLDMISFDDLIERLEHLPGVVEVRTETLNPTEYV